MNNKPSPADIRPRQVAKPVEPEPQAEPDSAKYVPLKTSGTKKSFVRPEHLTERPLRNNPELLRLKKSFETNEKKGHNR